MADASVPPVKVTRVDNIEMAHEFGEIAEGSLGEQMKVVGHQDVAVKLDSVNMKRLGKNLQKALSVTIIFEDVFLFISSAADMVNTARILNPERSGHVFSYHTLSIFVNNEDLTP